jgi:hypothetical protein
MKHYVACAALFLTDAQGAAVLSSLILTEPDFISANSAEEARHECYTRALKRYPSQAGYTVVKITVGEMPSRMTIDENQPPSKEPLVVGARSTPQTISVSKVVPPPRIYGIRDIIESQPGDISLQPGDTLLIKATQSEYRLLGDFGRVVQHLQLPERSISLQLRPIEDDE